MANKIKQKEFHKDIHDEAEIKYLAKKTKQMELFDIEFESRIKVRSTKVEYKLAQTLKQAFPNGYFDFIDNEGFRFYIDKDLGEHHQACISVPDDVAYSDIMVLLLENISYFATRFEKFKSWWPFSGYLNRKYRDRVRNSLSYYCGHTFTKQEIEMVYMTIQEPLNHRLAATYVNSTFRSYHIERPYKKLMRAIQEEEARERAERKKERLERQRERLERIEQQKAHRQRLRELREVNHV